MSRLLAVLAVLLCAACATGQPRAAKGLAASASANGSLHLVIGADPYDMNHTVGGNGTIEVHVTDVGDRWSPLQNVDLVQVTVHMTAGNDRYDVLIDRAMPHHPLSSYTTWFGVALEQAQHGDTGIGTSRFPKVVPDIALWGWARVARNDQEIARSVPAHVMVITDGPMKGISLLVGDEDHSLVGAPDGYLAAMWPQIASLTMPTTEQQARHYLGLGVLLALFVAFFWLASTEPVGDASRRMSRAA